MHEYVCVYMCTANYSHVRSEYWQSPAHAMKFTHHQAMCWPSKADGRLERIWSRTLAMQACVCACVLNAVTYFERIFAYKSFIMRAHTHTHTSLHSCTHTFMPTLIAMLSILTSACYVYYLCMHELVCLCALPLSAVI